MLREPPPDRLEGQQALPPRAEQEGLIGVILAGGKPDGEAADEPEPHLEGRVQPDSHDLAPYGRAGGDRMTTSSRLPGSDRGHLLGPAHSHIGTFRLYRPRRNCMEVATCTPRCARCRNHTQAFVQVATTMQRRKCGDAGRRHLGAANPARSAHRPAPGADRRAVPPADPVLAWPAATAPGPQARRRGPRRYGRRTRRGSATASM